MDCREINEILDKKDGSIVVAKAKVKSIYGNGSRNRALLVTENGLELLLFCQKWSYTFIENLKDVTKVGDEIEVAIYSKNYINDEADYLVSRIDLLPNPWEGIQDRFHKGDCVVCRIVNKKKGMFGGRLDGAEEIVVVVDSPKDKNLFIEIGEKYMCEVSVVYESSHTFIVVPYATCDNSEDK